MSQSGIRFVIDLNVGRAVGRALRERGHDVFFVGDKDPRMTDVDILRLAIQEQRIVITFDTDFGELVYRSGEAHAGILLLRMPNAEATEKVRTIEEIVTRYGSQLSYHFSVYRRGILRIR